MTDCGPMPHVASEIARWQDAALSLPLDQLQDMTLRGLDDLADSMTDFTRAYLASDSHDSTTEAIDRAVGEVVRRATATAIFSLGLTRRVRRRAALS